MGQQSTNTSSYRWQVLAVVMVGTLMSALDASIVNVSIPAIMADFGASLDDIEWVITGYMLAFASLMPLTAWMRDRIGHRALYVGSLAVFTFGSVLCGFAWNLPTLVIARVIQAIGGGALTPTGMAMITEAFEPHERGKALGFWAMGAIMGPAFGPTVGGYLTKYFGWPSIFLVNLPIGIIGIYFSIKILKRDLPHSSARKAFDFWGFIFLSVFLVSFLLGMSKGESEGWGSSYILTCGAIAAVGFTGFMLVESLVEHGIMDLHLLKRPVFAACFLLTAVRSVALYGGTFLLPVFLQSFKGLDEVESGLLMLPGSLFMGLLMPITGRLSDKASPRLLAFIGFFLLAISFFMYRTLDVNTSDMGVIMPTMVRGIGIALLIAPVTATAMNSVPKHYAGMASSMLNIIQQVGGSVGIAILGLTLVRRTKYHLNLVGSGASSDSPAFHTAFNNVFQRAHELGHSHAESAKVAATTVGSHIAKAASVRGFQDSFIVGGCIVLLAILCVFLLPSTPPTRSAEPIHLE